MAGTTEIQMETKQDTPGDSPSVYGGTEKPNDLVDDAVPERYRGSNQDKQDMIVHGKQQQLRRNFKLLTMTGLASMVVSAWEGLLPLFNYVLLDGGTALMFWGFIGVAFSMSLVYLSIAEMASMSPTAAGQYSWVSEFAPPRYQRFLSYSTGWLCAVGYHTFLASVCFMVGTIIQGLIIINNEDYVAEAWHGTLLTIAVITFAIIFNTYLAGKLPLTEGVAVIVHICGLFGVIIPLWVLSPRGDASEVLLQFTNLGGWPTDGLSAMIGLTTPLSIWVGYETPVHMAEEMHDASRNLPKSILGAVGLNCCLSFLMAMTLIFCVGDAEAALVAADDYNGYAFLGIFQKAVQNRHALNMMIVLVIFGLTNCAISETAVASRQIWSFARDQALPFSDWLAHVYPGQNIPLRAVLVSFCVTTLLALINIGSDVALNAINSLAGVSVLSSYIITIGCLIWRRLYGAPLPPRQWSLGRLGLPINIASFCCLMPLWFFAFWPLALPVDAATMNWSSVMFCGIILVSIVFWFTKGRHVYTGPVAQLRREMQ